MDDHPVHTQPNHHPPKMDILSKYFIQICEIILAAKCVCPPNSSDDLCLLFCLILCLILILCSEGSKSHVLVQYCTQ